MIEQEVFDPNVSILRPDWQNVSLPFGCCRAPSAAVLDVAVHFTTTTQWQSHLRLIFLYIFPHPFSLVCASILVPSFVDSLSLPDLNLARDASRSSHPIEIQQRRVYSVLIPGTENFTVDGV